MAIIRSRPVAGQAVRLGSAQVDRSLRAWEERVDAAEAAAYARARKELESEFKQRIATAEKRAADAEAALKGKLAEHDRGFEQRWGDTLTALAAATGELDSLRSQTLLACEGEVVRLALAVAARILQRRLDDETWITDVCRQALADLPARRGIVVRLHPDAAAEAARHIAAAIADVDPAPSMPTVEADPALPPGGCQIECAGTVVDVGLPDAWERVAEHLLRAAPSADLQAGFGSAADRTPAGEEAAGDAP